MKIAIHTFGCKLNQAESDELKEELIKTGFTIISIKDKNKDAVVVRACAVTCGASKSTRELIRSSKKEGALVVAVGCLENKNLPEINFVAKNNDEVINFLISSSKESDYTLLPKEDSGQKKRTRAFIKIQTGCVYNCSYCIIPFFRGKPKSIPVQKIIEKIKNKEKENYKEVVLTGVNIALYKDKEKNLANLLEEILKKTKIERIRLGSLDPRAITDDFINLFSENKRLLPHWHLSLQSASNKILKKMNRHYAKESYKKLIKKVRKDNKLFSITTDIIAGFPGETDEDFKDSFNFIKEIEFTKVHVFPFSTRPNTEAEKLKNHIQDSIKSNRAKKLRDASKKTGDKFSKKIIGSIKPILFENKKGEFWYGYSPEYIRIKYKSNKKLNNTILKIKIKEENLV